MILTKTLSLANRDPLTDLEALERANEWMEALIETVPLEMLEQCFANAKLQHTGVFPINYHELLDAYKRLRKLSGEDPGHSSYKAAVSRQNQCRVLHATGVMARRTNGCTTV